MYWLAWHQWSHAAGRWLTWDRVYFRGFWTPIVRLRWRYRGKADPSAAQ